MKKIYTFIKNKSIFFRLSLIIIAVVLVMLVLFLITSSNYKKEKIEYVYASVNQANHQTIHKIDDYIDDISNITKIPLTYKQMDDSYMNELDSFNQTGIKTYTFQQLNEQYLKKS